jgi:hypothetical protein
MSTSSPPFIADDPTTEKGDEVSSHQALSKEN